MDDYQEIIFHNCEKYQKELSLLELNELGINKNQEEINVEAFYYLDFGIKKPNLIAICESEEVFYALQNFTDEVIFYHKEDFIYQIKKSIHRLLNRIDSQHSLSPKTKANLEEKWINSSLEKQNGFGFNFNCPLGMVVLEISQNLNLEYISNKMEIITHTSLEEVKKVIQKDGFYWNDSKYFFRIKNALLKAIETQSEMNEVYSITGSKGEKIWLTLLGSFAHSQSGVDKFLLTYADVSSNYYYMQMLLNEKKRTEFIFSVTNMSIWELNIIDRSITFLQRQNDFHINEEGFIQNVTLSAIKEGLICEDSQNDFFSSIDRIMKGEELVKVILHVKNKQGQDAYQEVTYFHEKYCQKENCAMGYARNVTSDVIKEKKYENELFYLSNFFDEWMIDKGRMNLSKDQLETYTSYYHYDLCRVGDNYSKVIENILSETISTEHNKSLRNFLMKENLLKSLCKNENVLRF